MKKVYVPELEDHEANARKPLLTLGELLAQSWHKKTAHDGTEGVGHHTLLVGEMPTRGEK